MTGMYAGTVHSRVFVSPAPRIARGGRGPAMLVTVREPCVKIDNCDTILRDEEELGRGGVLVFCVLVFGALLDACEHSERGVFTPGKGMSRSTNEAT
jgi:hypothetical protein